MRDLTPRQQQILELIEQYIAQTGFPPTRAEIAESLGFRSANAAEDHLKALARKGVIEIASGASRGIKLKFMSVPDDDRGDRNRRGSGGSGLRPAELAATRMGLSLPLVGRVAAGSPILAQEHVEASYAVDPALFSQRPDYLLKVRGMSMRDAGILDGDLLAVRQLEGQGTVRTGQIVVARLGDEVTVKRFARRGNQIELLPENPDYSPILVDARDEGFSLEGLGVGLIRGGKSL